MPTFYELSTHYKAEDSNNNYILTDCGTVLLVFGYFRKETKSIAMSLEKIAENYFDTVFLFHVKYVPSHWKIYHPASLFVKVNGANFDTSDVYKSKNIALSLKLCKNECIDPLLNYDGSLGYQFEIELIGWKTNMIDKSQSQPQYDKYLTRQYFFSTFTPFKSMPMCHSMEGLESNWGFRASRDTALIESGFRE